MVIVFKGAHAYDEIEGERVMRTGWDKPDYSRLHDRAAVDMDLEACRGPGQLDAERGSDLMEGADVEPA